MATAEPARVDGRQSRTRRSRQAICDACLDLVQEGVLQPSADQIAQRAGLSRRSVFNHFSDLAELYDAVSAAALERHAPLLKEVPRDAPAAERVAMLAEVRTSFLEATAPFTRALTAQTLSASTGAQAWRVSQEALRREHRKVQELFQGDLAHLPAREREDVIEAMGVALSPLNWEYLRHSRGMSVARARGVVRRALASLLEAAGVRLD